MTRHAGLWLGVLILALLALATLGFLLFGRTDPNAQDLVGRLAAPSAAHWLGTDEVGRDILARLLTGARVTAEVVMLVSLLAVPVGTLVGLLAGYRGGAFDTLLMRTTDLFLALPKLVLALAFAAALGPGIENAAIAIAITSWPPYARIMRAETRLMRQSDFVVAAALQGASTARLLLRYILPLTLNSVLVRSALDMSGIILTAAGLGFLGLGVQPPTAEWGAMVAGGRAAILDQWWVATFPGLAILLVSVAFSLIGDGLRDLLDRRGG
jgi:peptide/nickel transport system permease protein